MPRRYGDYLPGDGFTAGERDLLGVRAHPGHLDAVLPLQRLQDLAARARWSTVDDPWGWGGSLEWATSCPPPRHNFVSLPRIRSERPAFDLHHPELADWDSAGYLATLEAQARQAKGEIS